VCVAHGSGILDPQNRITKAGSPRVGDQTDLQISLTYVSPFIYRVGYPVTRFSIPGGGTRFFQLRFCLWVEVPRRYSSIKCTLLIIMILSYPGFFCFPVSFRWRLIVNPSTQLLAATFFFRRFAKPSAGVFYTGTTQLVIFILAPASLIPHVYPLGE